MSCFFLLHDNLVPRANEVGKINSISFSSFQAPQYIGIYNSNQRARPWRTAGYFKVETGANQIIFRESVGVDLTASVAVGAYTTRALYLAAVKTALDAAGDSTYTVSIDTTGVTKILSNGVGGGGIAQFMWTNGASATQAGFLGFDTGADSTGALSYLADELSIHQYEEILIDLGLAANPKAFLMVGNRNGQISLSDVGTVRLQGNHTTNWTTPVYDQVISYHPTAMMQFNDAGLATDELRYWRILFTDPTNPLGYLDIYPIYLGDAYAPTRGAVQFPLSSDSLHFSKTVTLDSGGLYGTRANFGQSFSVGYSALTKSENERLLEIFADHGRVKPLFMMGDVNAVYSTEAQFMARMIKFAENPSYQLESPNFFSMELSFYEEL